MLAIGRCSETLLLASIKLVIDLGPDPSKVLLLITCGHNIASNLASKEQIDGISVR